ncbi:MAG TPA: DUF5668 domain-containing protein [Terriglobia bacterium]
MSQDFETVNRGTLGGATGLLHRVSLTWPVVLITLGLMFLADQFLPQWSFRKTWPVLLVVIGVLRLIESGRPPRRPAGPRI